MKLIPFLALAIGACAQSATIGMNAIDQPIDHFAQHSANFSQKYLVDSQYYRPPGPILLYLAGERAISSADLETTGLVDLAQATHAMIVVLESRFFGDSVPNADMEFLSVEQMLADVRQFVQHSDYSSPEAHWVVIGASFAGSLAAWTKFQYPELNLGVIASSAPMVVKDAYWEFDRAVAERLPCAAQLAMAVEEVDRILDSRNRTRIMQLKRLFGLPQLRDDAEFAAALALQQSELMQDPVLSDQPSPDVQNFCHDLSHAPTARLALAAFANATRRYPVHAPAACPADDDSSWFWLQCSQLGLWQTYGESHLRSRRLTLRRITNMCSRCFPEYQAEQRKRDFHVFARRAQFYYSACVPDALFTAGSLDPWRFLTMPFVRQCERSMVVDGASHAQDLLDPDELTMTRMVHVVESVRARAARKSAAARMWSGQLAAAVLGLVLLA